jgi:CRISPR/Cas system-associated endoribonuclease Cas2
VKSTKWKQEELFKELKKEELFKESTKQAFEKINKIYKRLARPTRGHRDSILINKIRNEWTIQRLLHRGSIP